MVATVTALQSNTGAADRRDAPRSAPDALHARIRQLADDFSIEVSASEVAAFVARPERAEAGMEVFVPWPVGESGDTIADACTLLGDAGFTPVPHLPARAFARRAALDALLDRLATVAGVEKVMLVGGDHEAPLGPFASALDVLATGLLTKYGVREVALAGYPDGHRTIAAPVLRTALADKIATARSMGLAPSLVGQFAFEPATVVAWCAHMEAAHADVPIAIGLPGPTRLATLTRYATRCGIEGTLRALQVYRASAAGMLAPVTPDRQLVAAAAHALARPAGRAPLRTHVFGFGSALHALAWMAAVHEGRFALDADGAGFTVLAG